MFSRPTKVHRLIEIYYKGTGSVVVAYVLYNRRDKAYQNISGLQMADSGGN